MTGLRRLLLLALVAWHRWRAERALDTGKRHALRADELEADADCLRPWGRS